MRDLFNRIPGPMSPMERDLKEHRDHLNALRELEEFKMNLINIVENYIKMIDMKIHSQDLKIDKTLKELTEDVIETAKSIVNTAMETGAINIEPVYNPEVEMLSYAMRTVIPDTPEEPEEPTTVTFTIDDGNPITVDRDTTWGEWTRDSNVYFTKEQATEEGYTEDNGYYMDDGEIVTEYGGFLLCVYDKYGVRVNENSAILDGDYYCLGLSIDGKYYEWNVNGHSGDDSWFNFAFTNNEFGLPYDIPDFDEWSYVTYTNDTSLYILDGDGKKVQSNQSAIPRAYYLVTNPDGSMTTFYVMDNFTDDGDLTETEYQAPTGRTWRQVINHGYLPDSFWICDNLYDQTGHERDDGVPGIIHSASILYFDGYVHPDSIIDSKHYK